MVVFPTPEGPDMTMSRPLGEVFKKGLALVRTEASDCTVVRDTDLFEKAICSYLPHVRHGYDDRLDLRAGHKVILISLVKNVLKRETATLEQVLDLCSYPPGLAGAFQSGRPLFVCHLW